MVRYVDRNNKFLGTTEDESGQFIRNSLLPRKKKGFSGTVVVNMTKGQIRHAPLHRLDIFPLEEGARYFYARQEGFLRRMPVDFPLNIVNLGELASLLPEVSPHHYVLLVVYKDDLDAQIGITGTLKKGEFPDEAAFREVSEETGIRMDNLTFANSFKTRNKSWSIYHSEITGVTEKGLPVREEGNDEKSQKVGVLLHGTLLNFDRLLQNSDDTIQEEGILGLAVVPVSSL